MIRMKSEIEMEAEQYLNDRLLSITFDDVENFKRRFNENSKMIRIDSKGARHLLCARIKKDVYDELNQ